MPVRVACACREGPWASIARERCDALLQTIVRRLTLTQTTASAPARLAQLKRELREMKTLLAWSPASGRPACFLKPKSAQGSLRLAAVQQLAQ